MKQGRVDEYMAEATPEQKMARTKSEQSGGWGLRGSASGTPAASRKRST